MGEGALITARSDFFGAKWGWQMIKLKEAVLQKLFEGDLNFYFIWFETTPHFLKQLTIPYSFITVLILQFPLLMLIIHPQ